MALTKGFIRNAATTPLDARLMDMAKIVCNADGSPRTGVLGGANASIVSTKATMHVAIAAAEFVTSKGKADGVAIFTNDGIVDVAIDAAPASNSRIDVIWVKHNDDTTGDGDALPTFGVTAGVAAASPTKPAIETGAEELATLRVYAGTTATNGGSNVLTNTYRMTAARGGAVPFRTKAELDLWTNPVQGQRATVAANGSEWKWTGAAWVPVSVGTKTVYARAAAVIATNGSLAAIPGMVALVDLGDFTHAAGVFTCVRAGTYRVDLSVDWVAAAAGTRTARILHSAGGVVRSAQASPSAGIDTNITVLGVFVCSPGDTLTVFQQQSSGGNLIMTADLIIERVV